MKEIKLRAWDTFYETMVYSSENEAIFYLENGVWSVKYIIEKNLSNEGIEIDAPVWHESDEVEIMLYTGLEDKNNKMIYEGDILKLFYPRNYGFAGIQKEEKIVIISFQSGGFWFTGDGVTDCNWHHYNSEDREVIGNIHQLPETIKSKLSNV